MTTVTAPLASPAAGVGVDRPPGLPRLAAVELRKMVDTRAGFWLLLGTVALMTAVPVLTAIFGEAGDQTLQDLLWGAIWPASVLLPIVGDTAGQLRVVAAYRHGHLRPGAPVANGCWRPRSARRWCSRLPPWCSR
jgi:hypothetical protein